MMTQKSPQAGMPELPDRDTLLQNVRKYQAFKRIQDVLLSLLALVFLWPLMLITAAAIILESPGASPFFVQVRVGKDGKAFRFYKFRSMYPGAEKKLEELLQYNEMDGPAFKMKDDPRVTRVGRFIRKTSIDELPQLLNILKGDMSIVGPRPGLPEEVAQYDDFARQRLWVTPGLTCYWQIQPYHERLNFRQWMRLDLQYIEDCGFLTDWKIIFATLGIIFRTSRQ